MISLSRFLPAVILAATALPALAQTVDLLPDIVIRESDLYDNQIVISGGRTQLRLSNATPNIGKGKLHLYGGTVNPNGTQNVIQRVFRSNGTFFERTAGTFTYHASHNHIHFDGWCEYRLRTILVNDGVGPVVATGGKTSFCILDLGVHDSTLPGYNPNGEFRSCGTTTQGLSVGWLDIYSKNLDGQFIDITGVPNGTYWLESEADPDRLLLESNTANNATRIKVTIGQPLPLVADAYEPSNSVAAVAARSVGTVNSPNLGPCNPLKTISNLSVHTSTDADYFRFYLPATGTTADSMRITFTHSTGDIDLRLLTSTGTQAAISQGTTNEEVISLNSRTAGWYYAHIYGYNGATGGNITLTIDPSANAAPVITTLSPPAGDTVVRHALETYTVNWAVSDPNANPTWVSVYLNTQPMLDGREVLIPDSLNVPGTNQFHVVNSANVPPGRYYVYCRATDGGTNAGSWSPGTVSFVVARLCPVDYNNDNTLNQEDLSGYLTAFLAEPAAPGPGGFAINCTGAPAGYDQGYQADYNQDCVANQEDLSAFITEYLTQVENPTTCNPG